MGKSRLTLGNGSHCGPFSHMRSTLRQTSYVVPGEIGAPVTAIVALRNTFEAIVSNPGGSTGVGGTGLFFAVSDNNSWTNLSIGDNSGALAGEGGGTVGVSTANTFLAALHSDQPNCLVYLL